MDIEIMGLRPAVCYKTLRCSGPIQGLTHSMCLRSREQVSLARMQQYSTTADLCRCCGYDQAGGSRSMSVPAIDPLMAFARGKYSIDNIIGV